MLDGRRGRRLGRLPVRAAPAIHLIVAILVGMAGGALWGGIAGLLKARTGAHEVIVTIMLNYVAFYLLSTLLLRTEPAPGARLAQPASPADDRRRRSCPSSLGERYNLHLGFLLALVAVAVRLVDPQPSALGFRLRAVGANPLAARTAGIDVERTYIAVMLIAGALAGLAGVNQVLGT